MSKYSPLLFRRIRSVKSAILTIAEFFMPAIAHIQQNSFITAIISVGLALLLMLALDPLARMTQTPFLLFFGAVVVSAWQGGIRSGLVATVLAAIISNYFFLEPRFAFTFDLADGVRVTVFVLECILISLLCGSLRAANQQFDRNLLNLKTSQEALRQSEERFRLSTRAVDGVVYDWDVQAGTVFRSEGLYRLIGIHAEDATTRKGWWGERTHLDDLARIEAIMTPIFQGSCDRYEFEYRVRHEAGHWVHVWDRGYLIRNAEGQLVRVVGSTVDITGRKQIEQEREQLLERERAARETAETANRIKDEFLAVLSHELRSPLNPILGWSRLLRTKKLDDARMDYALESIERNAKLQNQLVEDLLDVSRILRGKLNLTVVPINVVTIIESALETVCLAAEVKEISLRFEIVNNEELCEETKQSPNLQSTIDNQQFQVLGDSARLQQIVWNLLSNAVKFTPARGRVEVWLSLVTGHSSFADEQSAANDKGQKTKDKFVQITVTDTGKGISPEFLPHVFDYFRQEDGTTTRKFGGLGLGLAIVRHLVELHGGTVRADSLGEGQGATFTVRLPLMQGSRQIEGEGLEQSLFTSYARLLTDIRILLVDDDADSRDLIAFTLEQSGAIVTAVTSAIEALQVFEQASVDLLISDIGMPEMDGYMLIQQIRTMLSEQGGGIPAIALTAYAGELNQQQAIASGFQQHIAKPVEPEHLITLIANLIKVETLNKAT